MNLISRVCTPVARALVRGGVHPNIITATAALVLAGAGGAFTAGAIRFGALLLLAGVLLSVLDGEVARRGESATVFGAFFGSTVARVGEAAVFGGLALYFLKGGVPAPRAGLAVGAAIAALALSQLAAYARARAEALGVDAGTSLVGRAPRLGALGLVLVAGGAGPNGDVALWAVAALALLAALTVLQRTLYVAGVAAGAPRPAAKRDTLPGVTAARRKAV